MEKMIRIIFCGLICFAGFDLARADDSSLAPVEFGLIYDAEKSYLTASLTCENYAKPVELNEYSGNDIGLVSLKKLYSGLRQGDLKRVVESYFKPDGTYQKISGSLKADPQFFSKYKMLEKVEIQSKCMWGEYWIYNSRLYTKNESMDWRDELICRESICYVSQALDNSDDTERLFEAAYYFLIKQKHILSLTDQQKNKDLKHQSLPVFPEDSKALKKSFPLGFGIYPDLYEKNVYDFSVYGWEKNENSISPELKVVIQGFSEMKRAVVKDNDFRVLIPILEKWWSINKADGSLFFRFNVLKKIDGGDNKIRNIGFDLPAFYQMLQKWKFIRPIGKFVNDKTTYVLLEIEGDNDASTIQVVSLVGKNGNYMLELFSEDDSSAIIYSDVFLGILSDWVFRRKS